MTHFYEVLRLGKFIKTESRMVATRGRGGDMEGYCLVGADLLFGMTTTFWKWMNYSSLIDCILGIFCHNLKRERP